MSRRIYSTVPAVDDVPYDGGVLHTTTAHWCDEGFANLDLVVDLEHRPKVCLLRFRWHPEPWSDNLPVDLDMWPEIIPGFDELQAAALAEVRTMLGDEWDVYPMVPGRIEAHHAGRCDAAMRRLEVLHAE